METATGVLEGRGCPFYSTWPHSVKVYQRKGTKEMRALIPASARMPNNASGPQANFYPKRPREEDVS